MPSDYDPTKHHRRSIRLNGWDYASAGIYFITICTHQRQPLFADLRIRWDEDRENLDELLAKMRRVNFG